MVAPLVVLCGCGGIRSAYEADVRSARAAQPDLAGAELTDAQIAPLPAPVRRYLRACGYVGKGPFASAEIAWGASQIRFGPDAEWLDLETRQYNATAEPVRLAYLRARLFGLLPMEGQDTYRGGHGSMRIVLAKLFTVGDDRGPEMDQSALVTLLAEALLVPGYALAPYIAWEPIDDASARAIIRHRGIEASGVFHFNDADEFVRFDTDDRFYAEGGEYARVPWSAEVVEYVDDGGLRRPLSMRATWHRQDGDFEYFRGTIAGIRYDGE